MLTEPLALGSSTQLNCHDHRLTPAVRGATGSSSPEVGVLLNGAYGVKVKNCVLEGFDFGVVVVQTKVPPQGDPDDVARSRNRILSNTVSARLVGVLLVDADNAQISGNVVSGAVIGASAQSGGAEVVFAGNRIVGNAFAGLLLGGEALEAVTVTQNVLAENGYGLFFDGEGAEFFGARVSLNDLVGNRVGVGVGEDFSFSAELSVNVRGNYWGHTCEEGGFLAEDSSSRFVTDSHPYGRPVADSDDGDRPVPCR